MGKHKAYTTNDSNLATPVYVPSDAYMVSVDLGGAVFLDSVSSLDSADILARESGQEVDIYLDRIFSEVFTRETWNDLVKGRMVKYSWEGMHLYFGNEATMRDQFAHLSA